MGALGGLGPTIIAVMWLEQALSAIFVGLRLYCRTSLSSKSAKWGADDVLMLASLSLMLGYTIFIHIAAELGFGQRAALLTPEQFTSANKHEIIGQTFCIIGIAVSKAAVMAFQMRIYQKKWQKVFLWCTIIPIIGVCFFCALFDFVRCNPIEAVWNPFITDAVCFVSTESFTLLSVSLSVMCAAVDFIYAILPWVALWNLQMPKNTKIVICSAMSLGFFAGVCGIVRAVNLLGLNARSDYSYETVGLILWSQTELLVTMMTACIPTYRELWSRVFSQRGTSDYVKQGGSFKMSDRPRQGSRMDYGTSSNKVETQIYYGETDDRSDRGILHKADGPHEGVKVTRDVTVDVEGSRVSL